MLTYQFGIAPRRSIERSVIGHRAVGEICFAFRHPCNDVSSHSQVLSDNLLGSMRQPIGDTERMILGKIAIVENEDKVTLSRSDPLNRMPPASRKVPDVSRTKDVCSVGPSGFSSVVRHCPDIT